MSLGLRFLLLLTLVLPAFDVAAVTEVWLDVDPAIGLTGADVDDGLAMIQAFNSPELHVNGVSVVYGNAVFEKALPLARLVAEKFGPEGLPVAPGAASADALGEETEATRALVAALKARPMTLLALGPLTNIGTLLRRHPEIHSRIEQIVIVAGRRPGQRITPNPDLKGNFRDFNFEHDARAMEIILESAVPLVLAPWEVSSHVWVTNADMEALARTGETGAWIAEQSIPWRTLWKENFQRDGFNPFDTLAVAWVSHPQLIKGVEVAIWIEEGPDDTRSAPTSGEAVPVKPYLLVDPEKVGGRRAFYCYEPLPGFKKLLLQRLE